MRRSQLNSIRCEKDYRRPTNAIAGLTGIVGNLASARTIIEEIASAYGEGRSYNPRQINITSLERFKLGGHFSSFVFLCSIFSSFVI